MSRKKACVVLAAGQGKRMNNPETPKVLAELHGKPLLWYVFEQIKPFGFDKVVTITGYRNEIVDEFVNNYNLPHNSIAHQLEQKGTGHAVAQAESILSDGEYDVLILCGDVPLLQKRTIGEIYHEFYSSESDLTVLSAITENPTGYGRIIRDNADNFVKITEEKDSKEEEKKIKEINSGIYAVKSELLFSALHEVKNNNAQGEFYLTDVVGILKEKGKKVTAFSLVSFDELQGINTLEDLTRAGKYLDMQGR